MKPKLTSSCQPRPDSIPAMVNSILSIIILNTVSINLSWVFFWGGGAFGHSCSMQKFSGLGSNPNHSSDNAEFLTARPPGKSYQSCLYILSHTSHNIMIGTFYLLSWLLLWPNFCFLYSF